MIHIEKFPRIEITDYPTYNSLESDRDVALTEYQFTEVSP